jgi:anti-sigma factor RsiW
VADAASIPLSHGLHDRLLVAAEADRPTDRERGPALGRALLAACTECADLYADLVALATALPTAATPRRTRDFTLTAADAERLRPRGLRAWLARIGSPRDALSRPLAIGFTTLGLAGLLVATAPSVLPMAGAGGSGLAAPAAPTIESLEMAPSTAPSDGALQQGGGETGTTGEAPRPVPTLEAAPMPTPADPGRAPVIALSGVFLAIGAGVFALRRLARMR